MKRILIALMLASALSATIAFAADGTDALLASLNPQGRVNDFAGVFTSTQERAELETFIRAVEDKTGAQIAVVTVKSMQGGEINDFANRLFKKWGIGQKGKDNGVLLLAAITDRKVRIEVGYGLEGILPDALTARILDTHVVPLFKEGRTGAGLTRGVQAMAAIIAKDAKVELSGIPSELTQPLQPPSAASTTETQSSTSPLPGIFFAIFIGLFIILAIKRGKRGGPGGWNSGGGFSSGGSSSSSSSSSGGFSGGSSGGGGSSRSW